MLAACLVPRLAGVDVKAGTVPPLLADWRPRVGPGTVPAIALGVLVACAPLQRLQRMSWGRLLLLCYVAGVAWMSSLALVDGAAGIGAVLENRDEYLPTARSTTDVVATLHAFVSRIPYGTVDSWPTHVSGHPPGALLFFVGLVRLGLGSGLAAGTVVILIAATTPLAVAVTLRTLGVEQQARAALPFLVIGPAALWQAVSADAMFAAVVAWAMAALALAAVTRSGRTMAAWSLLAGLLMGATVMLSYGLPLVGLLAVAVLVAARSWRPLLGVAVAALAVVLVFAALGFQWWAALPNLHTRYWTGIARLRPIWYWSWGDLAALLFCAGPVLGAALGSGGVELRGAFRRPFVRGRHVVATLVGATLLMVVLADASMMSKAEVERIWLPFVPWLLLSTAWLPRRWMRPALIGQVLVALVMQHLLWSRW